MGVKKSQSSKTSFCALNGDQEDIENISKFEKLNPLFVGETKSSVETLLYALEKSSLSENESILISPCDAAIDLDWQEFLNKNEKMKGCEGIIFSYSGYPYVRWMPEQYGWLNLNADDSIKSIGYKKGWDANFKNPIITGHFWFPNIGKLKKNLNIYLESTSLSDKEVSIDEFCDFLNKNNKKVYSYLVEDFLCLGTSFEFRAYEYWLNADQISRLN